MHTKRKYKTILALGHSDFESFGNRVMEKTRFLLVFEIVVDWARPRAEAVRRQREVDAMDDEDHRIHERAFQAVLDELLRLLEHTEP